MIAPMTDSSVSGIETRRNAPAAISSTSAEKRSMIRQDGARSPRARDRGPPPGAARSPRRAPRRQRAHHQPPGWNVLGQGPDHRVDPRLQPVHRGSGGRGREQGRFDADERPIEDGAVEVLLVRKVVEERRLREADGRGELAHAHPGVAAHGEQALGGLEDLLATGRAGWEGSGVFTMTFTISTDRSVGQSRRGRPGLTLSRLRPIGNRTESPSLQPDRGGIERNRFNSEADFALERGSCGADLIVRPPRARPRLPDRAAPVRGTPPGAQPTALRSHASPRTPLERSARPSHLLPAPARNRIPATPERPEKPCCPRRAAPLPRADRHPHVSLPS